MLSSSNSRLPRNEVFQERSSDYRHTPFACSSSRTDSFGRASARIPELSIFTSLAQASVLLKGIRRLLASS